MQILLVFFLAALVGCYGDDDSECEEIFRSCMNALPMDVAHEACTILVKRIECMEKTVESDCAGDEIRDIAKSFIEKLKEDRTEICGNLKKEVSSGNCFDESKNWKKCRAKIMKEVLHVLEDQRNAEDYEYRLQCLFFMRHNQCVLRETEEECGAEAVGEFMTMIIGEIPDSVKKACRSVGFILGARALD